MNNLNAPHSLPDAADLRPQEDHLTVVDGAHRQLGVLSAVIDDGQGERIADASMDKQKLEAEAKWKTGEGLLQKLTALTAENTRLIEGENGLRTRLEREGDNGAVMDRTMDEILEGLMLEVPTYGELPTGATKHRYIKGQQLKGKGDEEPTFTYVAKFDQIDSDQKFLDGLEKSRPDLVNELSEVRAMLKRYADADFRHGAHRFWTDVKGNSYTSKALGKMGKATGFIALSTMALVTGVLSFMGKTKPTAAALYAFGAAFIGSPKLRASIMGERHEPLMIETGRVFTPGFNALCNTYGIKGEAWESIAESIYNDPATATFLRELSKNNLSEGQIATFIEETADGDKDIAASLKAMINTSDPRKSDLLAFARALSEAKSKQSKEVALDYIRLGSATFAKDRQKVDAVLTPPSS